MNYLAHIFLSGKNRKVQIGNFVGDAVKGRAYDDYPPAFRKGILLHRTIDDYADHHPLVRGDFGCYARVLTDIYFDHFLAVGFREYSGRSLRSFTLGFYRGLVVYYRCLPERFKGFLWHFILTDRLAHYASVRRIRGSLEIMARYRRLGVDPGRAVHFLEVNREKLKDLFERFLPDAQEMCRERLRENVNY